MTKHQLIGIEMKDLIEGFKPINQPLNMIG